MNPMPLSTDTNFASGNRGSTPDSQEVEDLDAVLHEELHRRLHVRGRDAVRGDALRA